MLPSYPALSYSCRIWRTSGALPQPHAGAARFQLMLPEEDHGELHRLAGETRMAAADLMRLGLRWVLANRDVLQRSPAADQRNG